ncbi:hypothetical protein NBRC10512_004318 [Rhodotorula toruloides]|uniref:glutathione gamma-glutamylcysteinyltransferase n=2 Tax=Rhodotorula toruloides TaxID=5286 RepID=A0A061BGS9_RHOTO|nr:glutathione gamma-glutamylcysteinyltransferase [Rhodotorula toruloides NP11]EMS23267.1 glutathione gamma-glutamylcysteinyltransferase [Rhodotorula toruloides NP11]CDR46211.1 RHTO0S12e01640g1_1 [Rhodotorula toruloides]
MATAPLLASQTSFYKRPLPETCIAFNSPEGKRLFAKALAEGNMESYFLLAPQMVTQNEPAYCALGTLVQILNSLEVDPQRKWKGGWRWYDQNMLDCCRPLTDIAVDGLTLPEFACLARCNGLRARIAQPVLDSSPAQREEALASFRRDLKDVSRGKGIMAFSYSRRTLGQTGDGHFSPIGALCEEEDMVLILDVARFKYPSYWIPASLAYESMLPLDKATGQPRGYAVLEVAGAEPGSLDAPLSLAVVTLNKSSWAALNNSLSLLLLAQTKQHTPLSDFVTNFVSHLVKLPTLPFAARPTNSAQTSLPPLLDQLSTTRLAQLVPFASAPNPSSVLLNIVFALALLSPRSSLSSLIPPNLADELATLAQEATSTVEGLREEVENATKQLGALGECCRSEEGNQAVCKCAGPDKQVEVD